MRRPMVPNSATESEAEQAAPPAPHWMIVQCAGRSFALALERVVEILPPREFVRLPGSGPQVCGIIGVRGRVITSFDLGVIAGLHPSRAAADYRILLVEHGDRVVGLVADQVAYSVESPLDAAPPAESALNGAAIGADELLGAVTVDGAVIMALDIDQMLGRLLGRRLT
jgi:purine-binding chemotaxis protein CheW